MRRALIVVLAALPLTLGVAAAQADGTGDGGGTAHAVVAGTIVSVDTSAGTFVANAAVVTPHSEPGQGGGDSSDWSTPPTTTQVTITTNSSTKIEVDGQDGSVSDLAAGQRFYSVLPGSPSDSIETLVANPALVVGAETPPPPRASHAAVGGTIVSVDTTAGTFVADASILGEQRGDHGDSADGTGPPSTTQVTITTNSNTRIRLGGHDATIADLAAGQKFRASFDGSASDSIETLVANPALEVSASAAREKHQLYAFVGSVTGVDPTGGTVTVEVTRSLPSGLIPVGLPAVQFTVGPNTLILGGPNATLFGGSLSDVSVGDIVAGGLRAPAGLTLTQVESTPLMVLLDLPATTSSGSPSHQANVRAKALKKALALLGDKPSKKKSKGHTKSSKKSHAHHSSAHKR